MAAVGAAAASQHIEHRQRRTQAPVAFAEVGGLADVEFGGGVEFGVAACRGIGAQAADAFAPGAPFGQDGLEVARVRAVDRKVGRRRVGVDTFDRLAQRLGSRPSVSTVNEIATGKPSAVPARATPIASAEVVMVTAASMSTPPSRKAAACGRW